MSFNVLQQRIARKKLTPEVMAEVPVAFVAYDLLYLDGGMVAEVEIEERRGLLAGVAEAERHPLYLAAETIDGVDRLFAESRERGNEGLILKRKGSLYEAGKRSGAWLKLKRPYATLDVVVTAAEQGHGRRAIWLSDYTFGVRDGERFVNVGKAYSGLTDAEIRELTRIFRAAAIERFGRVVLVQPEVVLEVAFDLIQKSSRHKGGYALRFPRIVRWRRDKTPAEADTLERVRELYEASLRR
jgi:DNA ligase-1